MSNNNDNDENDEDDKKNTTTTKTKVTGEVVSSLVMPNIDDDDSQRNLKKGDLVRIRERNAPGRQGGLGRIHRAVPVDPSAESADRDKSDGNSTHPFSYDVDCVLGGRMFNVNRTDLIYTTPEMEGLADDKQGCRTSRRKRQATNKHLDVQQNSDSKGEDKKKPRRGTKKTKLATKGPAKKGRPAKATPRKPAKLEKKTNKEMGEPDSEPLRPSYALDVYERHRREFEKCLLRLEKVDQFGFFLGQPLPGYDEFYEDENDEQAKHDHSEIPNHPPLLKTGANNHHIGAPSNDKCHGSDADILRFNASSVISQGADQIVHFPSHPPFNWTVVRKRMNRGRYVLDRIKIEAKKLRKLLAPYERWKGSGRPTSHLSSIQPQPQNTCAEVNACTAVQDASPLLPNDDNFAVYNPKAVHWDLFHDDVTRMCDAAISRDPHGASGGSGTLGRQATKIKEVLEQVYSRTGKKQKMEVTASENYQRFFPALSNAENFQAAMQGEWRKDPFPERRYVRLASYNVVCDGLSKLDERSAIYELKTSLPDSFVGISYSYDDFNQSESWMKAVVYDTTTSAGKKRKNDVGDVEKKTAIALASDNGVVRAQVQTTVESLLRAVQDRVMTENGVLRQPEMRSANWEDGDAGRLQLDGHRVAARNGQTHPDSALDRPALIKTPDASFFTRGHGPPEIAEQPVWGIDCYTRRNIELCLGVDFEEGVGAEFISRWLLPAINSCPTDMAHDISSASRVLEGDPKALEKLREANANPGEKLGSHKFLSRAMAEKIASSGPPWLQAAAHQLRVAAEALGNSYFRVHPKGHGAVVLRREGIPANTLVTYYRGEVYPPWRWGEKLDAIEQTQQRLALRPNLPDFYNMALERPHVDPRGFGLLFVDASRKAGWGSSLSHSCEPTCEVRVVAVNGMLSLAMTTVRYLEQGEELTFDYNAVTESLNEYRSAICLCGHQKCRGSFLHFATADCYQQVLSRNAPIAVRFSSLAKGSMKKVMSQDDTRILEKHGFGTAAFGAVSFNHHRSPANVADENSEQPLDSVDHIPIWLRTFVADTLRYIQYERRALPIALLCNHISRTKSPLGQHSGTSTSQSAKNKQEPLDTKKDSGATKKKKLKFRNQEAKMPSTKPLNASEDKSRIEEGGSELRKDLKPECKRKNYQPSGVTLVSDNQVCVVKTTGPTSNQTLELRGNISTAGESKRSEISSYDNPSIKKSHQILSNEESLPESLKNFKTPLQSDTDMKGGTETPRNGTKHNDSKQKVEAEKILNSKPISGSKPENVFLFFAKNQRDTFISIMKEQGFSDLKGLALTRAVQKIAGITWRQLSDEMKQFWKDKALVNWELNGGPEKAKLEEERKRNGGEKSAAPQKKKQKRTSMSKKEGTDVKLEAENLESKKRNFGNKNKAVAKRANTKIQSNKSPPPAVTRPEDNPKTPKKRKRESSKYVDVDQSQISFQSADAEGWNAMEQRIQQLGQSLSRVGRVLDRHREAFVEKRKAHGGLSVSPPLLRSGIHSPLRILEDEFVVGWLWNHPEGTTQSLLRIVRLDSFGNCSLAQALIGICTKYSHLERFPYHGGSGHATSRPSTTPGDQMAILPAQARKDLKKAYLELSECIQSRLDEMENEVKMHEEELDKQKQEARREYGRKRRRRIKEAKLKLADKRRDVLKLDGLDSIETRSAEEISVGSHQSQGTTSENDHSDTAFSPQRDSDLRIAQTPTFLSVPLHTIPEAGSSDCNGHEYLPNGGQSNAPGKFDSYAVQNCVASTPQESASCDSQTNNTNRTSDNTKMTPQMDSLDACGSSSVERRMKLQNDSCSFVATSVGNSEIVSNLPMVSRIKVEEIASSTSIVSPFDQHMPSMSSREKSAEAITSSQTNSGRRNAKDDVPTEKVKEEQKKLPPSPWLEHRQYRHKLEAMSDTLLMYAHTSIFFVLNPYISFESTPIEVYARELGNSVPRSVVETAKAWNRELNNDSDPPKNETAVKSGKTQSKGKQVSTKPKHRTNAFCKPDDIITTVNVKYPGDYVLSLLLQWYTGGIGLKPGLPGMLGCVALPSIAGCWSNQDSVGTKASSSARSSSKFVTEYTSVARPQLIAWFEDQHQRGNPWSDEISRYFSSSSDQDNLKSNFPMGSPVLDFLVVGDETNIHNVLRALRDRSQLNSPCELNQDDEHDEGRKKKSAAERLQSSVDEGMPAQAVANWVQCENPACMKWRKLPWHVDVDVLPDQFFCKDNVWDVSRQDCSSPEETWDEKDAPIKFQSTKTVEETFHIGAKFDVQQQRESKFTEAVVVECNFSAPTKQAKFHFLHCSRKHDEWINIDSARIAPHMSYSRIAQSDRNNVAEAAAASAEVGKVPPKQPESGVNGAFDRADPRRGKFKRLKRMKLSAFQNEESLA